MLRKIYLICLLSAVFMPVITNAQTFADTLWTKVYGGTGFECPIYHNSGILDPSGTKIARDDKDNFYITTGTTSADGYVGKNSGIVDVWVLKLNSKGDTLWTKVIGGTNIDSPTDIVADGNGGCIVVGLTYSDDGDFAGTGHHGTQETTDGFVAIFDANGNVTKIRQYGGKPETTSTPDGDVTSGGHDGLNAIIKTSDGNYMCVGYSNSYSDDLGPLDDTQYWAGWFLKVAPDAKKLSSKKISLDLEGPEYYQQILNNVVETEDGYYVAWGELIINLNSSMWIVKTDGIDNTKKIWGHEITNGGGFQQPLGLSKLNDGNYVVSAWVIGTGYDIGNF